MLRNWSGVGGGVGMITFLALAHMLDATQLVRGGWVGVDDNIPCTCTHVGCYATGQGWVVGGMITFLALAHMLDATQLVGDDNILALAHMLDATQLVGDDNIPCTCTHVGCYATGRG